MGAEINGSVFIDRLSKNPKLKNLHDRAEKIVPVDAGHDFFHTRRVAILAAGIFEEEIQSREKRSATASELDACFASALMHDCVPVPKNSPLRKESARLCSEKAREWLKELSWEEGTLELICGAILDHSFSSGRIPSTLVGEALQDADRLEALGALGLYRTIATGVSMGTLLFDPEDPWAEKRELDDRRFTIDHFFIKLLKLPEGFRTKSARGEAQKRADFLRDFLANLKSEII